MPETPEQIFERSRGNLRRPALEQWETWPFEGEFTPKDLLPPVEVDRPRHGSKGGCWRCKAKDEDYAWVNDNWRLTPLREPSGLPVVMLLEPRQHFAEPGDLPPDLAAEQGLMLSRVEHAIRSIGEIGRVHVCRWGDGGEHLHWWFMARPPRLPQIIGSFIAIWDDILPPTPKDIWDDNVAKVVANLEQLTS